MSFLDYASQPLTVTVDGAETFTIEDPFLFTIGNVSGWGGGALIDPDSDPSDGKMELVAGRRRDAPRMLADIASVFTTGTSSLPGAINRSFHDLLVERPEGRPIQLDGELVAAGRAVRFTVESGRMKLLVPSPAVPRPAP